MCERDEMRVEQRKENCIFKSKHPEIPRICSFLIYHGQAKVKSATEIIHKSLAITENICCW